MMRIDSHQHYWKPSRGDYHWMTPPGTVLHRDYLPADLRPSLERHKIQKTVLVQAAQTVAETEFLLELAASDDSIAGVVGWLDMEAPDFTTQFEHFRRNPKFIGLRPMLQDLEDDRWILRSAVVEALRHVASADFPFEFLTYTRHLPYVLEVLDAVPGLRAAIDHVSKPEIRAGKLDPWRELIVAAARHPNLFCKLSGMVTEADHQHWRADDLRPYVEHVVACFGFDRVMFGSDWPVCLLAASYDQVIGALNSILASELDQDQEKNLFGLNAARFYKLTGDAA
jgi:L-fuconolactonase